MRRLAVIVLCAVLSVFPATVAHGRSYTAADAVGLGSAANGRTVTVEGEAIGEALRADTGRVWVNLLSGGTALGVVMTAEDAAKVRDFGRYQRVGSSVRVTGVYNVGCDDHGGDVDIHATAVEVLSSGYSRPERPALWQLGVSVALFATATFSAVRYRRARREYESG